MSKETATTQRKPRLTKKQKDFAKAYLETGNGTQSALKAYDTTDPNTANQIALDNLQKPTVKQYLESKAEKAAEFVYQLAESAENEGVRLGASKDILDRAGYKPVDKSQSVSISIEASVDELDKLQQIAGRSLLEIEDD